MTESTVEGEITLAGYSSLTKQQLASSGYYSLMMEDYKTLEELPVPEGVSQSAVAGYIHYLGQRDRTIETMKQSLRLAHLIEDSGYLQYLITVMLASWTADGYQQVIDDMSEELLSDVYFLLPHICLPSRLQRDHKFLSRWATTVKARDREMKFTVDGQTFGHLVTSNSANSLQSLFYTCSGKREYLLCWYPSGIIQSVHTTLGCGTKEITDYYETGSLSLWSYQHYESGSRIEEVRTYYSPSGRDKLYVKYKDDKVVEVVKWPDVQQAWTVSSQW